MSERPDIYTLYNRRFLPAAATTASYTLRSFTQSGSTAFGPLPHRYCSEEKPMPKFVKIIKQPTSLETHQLGDVKARGRAASDDRNIKNRMFKANR